MDRHAIQAAVHKHHPNHVWIAAIEHVSADTLQVLDPGVCLANAHSVLTLDAMPSVIREAVEDGVLVITRRS